MGRGTAVPAHSSARPARPSTGRGPTVALGERAGRGAGASGGSGAQSFTYSKSMAWLLMPRSGGAIQPANFPGSVTGRMSDFT